MSYLQTETDLMYERESEMMWEEMNKQDFNPLCKVDTDILIRADSKLTVVKENDIDNALEWISETIDLLKGTPSEDRLASIYDDLYNLNLAIIEEMKKIREGWENR